MENAMNISGITVAELDFNNQEHRRLWCKHMKLCGLKNAEKAFADKACPVPEEIKEATVFGLNLFISIAHEITWDDTYKILPQLKGLKVTFDGNTGKFITRKPTEDEMNHPVACCGVSLQ